MLKRTFILLVVFLLSVMIGGCVSSGKFEKKVAEADGLNQALQALQQKYDKLTAENNNLK